ncbi:hypothetical protein JCM10450v2_005741 [Rhodotorula kratochvilovae]
MLPELELRYWPIRGRAYPIVLMLKAARVPFTYSEIPFDAEEHHGRKQRGDLCLDELPFGALPVLKVKTDEGETIIAEVSAIVRYLEKVIAEELAVEQVQPLPPLEQARVDMIHSASLFNSTTLYNSASSSTWLEGEQRAQLKRERVIPFLRGLEHQLTRPAFPRKAALEPRALSNGGMLFSAAACAAAYTLSMVVDVFPFSLAHPLAEKKEGEPRRPLEEQFPTCAGVLRAVEGSPGFAEWVASGARKERWSNWPSYTPENVRQTAEQYDREEAAEGDKR